MLRPSVEELVRVKDVDVQMREFLANLRVTVEAGQKGKKKKAKKKPKKKKEKKSKKKKDPTEGRSIDSIYGELVVAGIVKRIPSTRLANFQVRHTPLTRATQASTFNGPQFNCVPFM